MRARCVALFDGALYAMKRGARGGQNPPPTPSPMVPGVSWACLLVVLVAATACSPTTAKVLPTRVSQTAVAVMPAAPTDTPAPTNTPAPTPTATEFPTPVPPPPMALNTEQVDRQAQEVMQATAKIRGLKAKHQVTRHFLSPAQLKYLLTQRTLAEYTRDEARRDVRRLWLLMFIDDPTMDFRALEVEFAGQAILGFYDPAKKELFVRTDQPTLSPMSRETLAHEFVHSLQDQHYDLQNLLREDVDEDRSLAIRALVEGDATISGLLYVYHNMDANEWRKLFKNTSEAQVAPAVPTRAPVYLQEAWKFPYTYGSDFVLALAQPGEYAPVNRAFTDPPKSTEQIMHPEKYTHTPRDEPLPVQLPDLAPVLGSGWQMVETDTLGEFHLMIMLMENYVDRPEAAEGWGGARYALYENGDEALVVMGSRWDTPADLAEFEEALTSSFKLFQRFDPYEPVWHDTKGRVWGLKRSGDQLMFVSGTDADVVRKVMTSLAP